MAPFFNLDASALVKRYVVETGTAVVNYLFQQVSQDRMMCLTLSTLEVVSIFVRKRNAALLPLAAFRQALTDFRKEVFDTAAFTKISATDVFVKAAMPLVEKHSLNATDAILLHSALDVAYYLRAGGGDLVLVASDQRLLRAARAEGLVTFDPETETQAALDVLLGP